MRTLDRQQNFWRMWLLVYKTSRFYYVIRDRNTTTYPQVVPRRRIVMTQEARLLGWLIIIIGERGIIYRTGGLLHGNSVDMRAVL